MHSERSWSEMLSNYLDAHGDGLGTSSVFHWTECLERNGFDDVGHPWVGWFVVFIVRDVFEASPEGCLERGFLFNAGCGSESEDESEGEKNRAELHFSFEKRLGDGTRGKRGKGFVFRSKVVDFFLCSDKSNLAFTKNYKIIRTI